MLSFASYFHPPTSPNLTFEIIVSHVKKCMLIFDDAIKFKWKFRHEPVHRHTLANFYESFGVVKGTTRCTSCCEVSFHFQLLSLIIQPHQSETLDEVSVEHEAMCVVKCYFALARWRTFPILAFSHDDGCFSPEEPAKREKLLRVRLGDKFLHMP